MKKYNFLVMVAFCLTAALLPQITSAQNKDSAKIAAMTNLIASKRYTFKAQNMTPQSGAMRQLNTDYDVQVSADKIVSQLPYFGRAYSAPVNTTGGGIEFTSKDFVYNITNRKKDGWDINIKFKDVQDTQQMQLTVFSNGTASLNVISTNRDPISFNGYITAPKKTK